MTTQGNISTGGPKSVSPPRPAPEEDRWTTTKIAEEFANSLARAHTYVTNKEFGHTLIVSKYYERAAYLWYRIPLDKPTPWFDVEIGDLWPSLKRELAELRKIDPAMFHYVTKIAVGHIFENLNFEYFHRSVMRLLKVRFIP